MPTRRMIRDLNRIEDEVREWAYGYSRRAELAQTDLQEARLDDRATFLLYVAHLVESAAEQLAHVPRLS